MRRTHISEGFVRYSQEAHTSWGSPETVRWEALTGRCDAFRRFDADLASGTFRRGLRVKRVQGTDSVFEMTWAPDVRATFECGSSTGDEAHVTWRRIGRHDILRRP